MEKDQIKAIIKDLRSKGLSFGKISYVLRESYSVDLNRETVRKYFQDIQKANNNTIQDNAESTIRETASTIETHNATGGESSSVQIPVEKKQEQNIKNVQPVRKVRYPGYEDEDLRKDPHYGSISRDYLEMTPRQRYEQHLERVKQDRKERNKSIALFALLVLMLVGIAFALKYRII
jgi:hypothetical protein